MSQERRVYQRLIVNRPANRDFSKPSPSEKSTTVLDLGPEGVGFTVNEKLKLGEYIFLDIDLGAEGVIELSVQILWVEAIKNSQQYRIGGRIRDAKKDDLEKLVRFYCEQLIPVKKEETY